MQNLIVVTCIVLQILPEEDQVGKMLQLFCQQVMCIIVRKKNINLLRLSMSTKFYHNNSYKELNPKLPLHFN